MDKIRVGIIGSGGIFRNLHAPYYQEPNRRADIVAVADLNAESADEQAAHFGAQAYTDYRHLLDRTDIEAVDVCCHPAPHLEITLAAAAAGKHTLNADLTFFVCNDEVCKRFKDKADCAVEAK